MEKEEIFKKILFIILLILTLVFIFFLFFPKKSYVEKKLENEQIETTEKQKGEKLLCMYEYIKEETVFTNWSEWSEWSKEKKESNELTKVEEKTEKIEDGTDLETEIEEIYEDAIKVEKAACPNGFTEENGRCKRKVETTTISASIKYDCPKGFVRSGEMCYCNNWREKAKKTYYCPANQGTLEFELNGTNCRSFYVSYMDKIKTDSYYTCEEGYLYNNKCIIEIEKEKEVPKYKEETYYRYQTREKKNKIIDIKWSRKDNQDLLNNGYNVSRKITCEF
jgi:hypothetical protein